MSVTTHFVTRKKSAGVEGFQYNAKQGKWVSYKYHKDDQRGPNKAINVNMGMFFLILYFYSNLLARWVGEKTRLQLGKGKCKNIFCWKELWLVKVSKAYSFISFFKRKYKKSIKKYHRGERIVF